jgi:hypothetical protein
LYGLNLTLLQHDFDYGAAIAPEAVQEQYGTE